MKVEISYENDPELIRIAVSYTHLDVYKRQLNIQNAFVYVRNYGRLEVSNTCTCNPS